MAVAELDVFIKGLTEDSIDRAVGYFRDAINTRKLLRPYFDPRTAQQTCDRILQLTANGSFSTSTVHQLPRFWANLNALAHNSNLNALESCITRVYCMRSALRLHHWLLEVIPAAVKRETCHTWIDKLVWDVGRAMDLKKTTDFNSKTYLPNLEQPITFNFIPGRFLFEKSDLLISTVSSIIRVWLLFPPDEQSLVQLSVIDIIYQRCPPSVMFLDKVWESYKTPFATVFKNWEVSRSKSRLKSELKAFEKKFASHPFATPNTLEHQKLKYLGRLTQEWMENNNSQGEERDAVRAFFFFFFLLLLLLFYLILSPSPIFYFPYSDHARFDCDKPADS